LERNSDILRPTTESHAAYRLRRVLAISRRTARRVLDQPLPFIEPDRLDADVRGFGDGTDGERLHSFGPSSHSKSCTPYPTTESSQKSTLQSTRRAGGSPRSPRIDQRASVRSKNSSSIWFAWRHAFSLRT